MSEFRLHQVEMLHLLWLAPLLVWLFYHAAQRRKQALEKFASSGMLGRIGLAPSPSRRRWKNIVFIGGLVLIVLGSARPAWNLPGVEKRFTWRDSLARFIRHTNDNRHGKSGARMRRCIPAHP